MVHNIFIGKYCSISDDITFIIDSNHDYKSICMGENTFLKGVTKKEKIKRKDQIIIQNDVWIGYGATIMGGVTIHNGAVIASKSVVTKDVMPYEIVGGNPAKTIGYRFNREQIEDLLDISWWNWNNTKLYENCNWFKEDIDIFINRFKHEVNSKTINGLNLSLNNNVYLLIPDLNSEHAAYKRVLQEYCDKFSNMDTTLIIFIEDHYKYNEEVNIIKIILIIIVKTEQIF